MVRILLADDDVATLDFMSRSLANEGYEVVTAQDGQDASEKFAAAGESFDLLITDVEMPGLDGIELAKTALAAHPGLKILLMSGFEAGMDRATDLKNAGAHAVSKPLSLEQIRSEVKTLLG